MGRGFRKAFQRYGSGLFRNLNFLSKFNRMFHLGLNLKNEIFLLFRIGSEYFILFNQCRPKFLRYIFFQLKYLSF